MISGNTTGGVRIVNASSVGNRLEGNLIGLCDGTAALPNSDGVVVLAVRSNTIGGTSAAARNIISGNTGSGILIDSAGSTVPAR